MALSAIGFLPAQLSARSPAPQALAVRLYGGEVQAVGLVAGWLAAHFPSKEFRHAMIRRASSAIRQCGCTAQGCPAATKAAQPALWLLDGLWRASAPFEAASECQALIAKPYFDFGSPPLLPHIEFSQARVADGTALCIALAIAAPLCERLRVIDSQVSLQVRALGLRAL